MNDKQNKKSAINILLFYKTQECSSANNCALVREECPYFHKDEQVRRQPFDFHNYLVQIKCDTPLGILREYMEDTSILVPLYAAILAPSLCGSLGCLNDRELAFHPLQFKNTDCPHSYCKEHYCSFAHSVSERTEFDELRAALSLTPHPLSYALLINECLSSALSSSQRHNSISSASSKFYYIPPETCYTSVSPSLPSKDIRKFTINEKLDEFESIYIEFKHFSRLDINTALDYICGFLNSYGGSIFFGVNDDGIVKGINLSRKEIDHFQVNLDIALRNFSPTVFPDQVRVKFHDISPPTVGRYLLQIDVFCASPEIFYTTDRQELFLRKQGSLNKLSVSEIVTFVKNRLFILHKNSPLNPQLIMRMSPEERSKYALGLRKQLQFVQKNCNPANV